MKEMPQRCILRASVNSVATYLRSQNINLKISNIGNSSLQGKRLFLSFPFLSAHLGSTFFPRGVHISREISTGGVLISREISTGGVLIFGEYLFSVTGVF